MNMKIHVKICGITCPEDALIAEKCGASAVGFVFYHKSPRYITPEKAGEISKRLGPFTARVGVCVDENLDMVRDIVKTAHLTAVQLHGAESPEYINGLKGVTVIKAFRVTRDFDCKAMKRYNVSAFLLDTFNTSAYGGTGKTFDWKKAFECRDYGRIIIAGGLNASNVREAVNIARPWGVDVSSGVESSPGIKDHEKIRIFFHALYKENDR